MTKQTELRNLLNEFANQVALAAGHTPTISDERSIRAAEHRIFALFDRLNDEIASERRATDNVRKQRGATLRECIGERQFRIAAERIGVHFNVNVTDGTIVGVEAKLPNAPQQPMPTVTPFDLEAAKRGDPIEVLNDAADWVDAEFVGSHVHVDGIMIIVSVIKSALVQSFVKHVRMKAKPARQVQMFANVTTNQSPDGLCGAVYTSAVAARKGAVGYKPDEFAAIAEPVTITVVGSQHSTR